jgi:predicted ATPase
MEDERSELSNQTIRLEWFEVENFRLFKKTRFELHPDVTVIVGLNDSGKSTLLEAMNFYGQVQRVGFRKVLERDDFEATDEQSTRFRCRWSVDGEPWEHEVVLDPSAPRERLSGRGQTWTWNPRARDLVYQGQTFHGSKSLAYSSLAQLSIKDWQLGSKVPANVFGPTSMTRHFNVPLAHLFQPESLAKLSHVSVQRPNRTGFGWANWLQTIINRRDGTIEDLEATIGNIFPHFRGVRVFVDDGPKSLQKLAVLGTRYSTPSDHRELGVTIQLPDGNTASARKISSGLLLALAHLALVNATPKKSLILLEEPENGLNEAIMLDMMRAFLNAVRRRNQQLVMTTHHAWWLDLVPHDSIRVMMRDAQGSHVESPIPGQIQRIVEEKNIYPSEVMSLHGPLGLLRLGRVGHP